MGGSVCVTYQINAAMSGSIMCGSASARTINTTNIGGGQSHDHTLSANFVGSANSVLSPYLVLIYIIKT